jgi:hypothetical protein
MTRRSACAIAMLIMAAGCVDRGTQAERFFGESVWDAMEKAVRLEAYRLEPSDNPIDGKRTLKGGVKIVGQPLDPGEDWLKVLALVEDPRSYDWGSRNDRKPKPEVLFRFVAGSKQVDLLIAFNANKASLDWSSSTDETKWADITNARPFYVELVQRVFLLDQFIRSLKPESSGPNR